jgi:serine/threonine protein kinase
MRIPLSSPTLSAGAPESARRLGPFVLVRPLGRGGFAPVWLADEVHDGRKLREVAIKLFRRPAAIAADTPEAARWRDAIIDEAHALCRIEHPNVVRFHALVRDEQAGVVGLVMEHVVGAALDVVLRERGPLPIGEVVETGVEVAWALAAVHGAGLVHRDVKPGNVIRGVKGYKLIDFGIVGDAPEPTETQDAAAPSPFEPTVPDDVVPAPGVRVAGTVGYIAPECLRGAPASPSSDLYALGVTLFKLATGVRPDDVQPSVATRELLADGARAPAATRLDAHLPRASPEARALADIVERLLAEDRSARPRHAAWIARELAQILTGRGPIAPPPDRIARPEDRATTASPAAEPATTEESDAARGIEATQVTSGDLYQQRALVGRDAELATLLRDAEEAAAGGVRVVLIAGPLGVGRTRLLDAACERLSSFTVLRASCSPERQSPLRPLARALDPAPASLRGAAEAMRRAIAPGAIAAPTAADDALEGVEEALLAASRTAPLALVLDDLQWGDAHTLKLLRLLLERAAGGGAAARLLVLAAVRHEPSPSAHLRALLTDARGRLRAGVRHVPLPPLGPDDAAALARAVLPVEPVIAEAVARRAGGVPFFVVHALASLREMGAITREGDVYRAADPAALDREVPGVAELLEARLATSFDPASGPGKAALRALAAVALHGGGLAGATLARLAGDDEDAEAAIEALVAAGILTVSGPRQEHGFAQEMVRQAALNLVGRRPWLHRLHRAMLDAVAAGEDAAREAAFLAAGYEALGARAEARTWLKQAVENAAAVGLFADAVELGDRLAALAPDEEARADAELTVATMLVRARRFEEAERRLDRLAARAAVIGRGPAWARADVRRRILALSAARGMGQAGRDDPTLIADADALGDAALACEARMALAGVLPEPRALELATEAIAHAKRAGPALTLSAHALRFALNYAANRRDIALAEADITRALAIAAAAGTPWDEVYLEGDLAAIEAEQGRLESAIARLRGLVARTTALGMRGQLRLYLSNLAALLLRTGAAAEAAALAARTNALAAEAGDPLIQGLSLSLRAEALRQSGSPAEALAAADEAERIQRARDDRLRALTLIRRAEILAALGRPDEALADARACREAAARHGDRDLEVGAAIWEALHLARRGQASAAEVAAALAEARAAGVTLRPLTRALMESAEAYVATCSAG